MNPQRPTAWPAYPAARRNPREQRDRTAWIAPTVATVLLTVLVPAAAFLGLLSVMATDSCGTDCSRALTTSLTLIHGTLFFGAFLTHGAWVTAWALPWTRRWSALRIWTAALSLLPPVFVLILVFTLPGA
ncbi:hypothetical protein ACFFKE_22735 [Streptomyces mutabilis]|uniref:hypothetical protein n=1 Tax=Streptomyces mutabilis TaxID=67332 RepID=UPI001781615E|nr:hypothetical protein [Streptomyces mutabilis]